MQIDDQGGRKMKKFWSMAISLLLAITCTAAALADGTMYATPLSLKDKIQKVKDRSYLNDGVDNKIIRSSGKTNSTQLPSVLEMDGCGEVLKYYVEDSGYKLKMYYNFAEIETRDLALEYVEMLVEDYGYELKYEELGPRKSTDARHSTWLLEHPDSNIGADKPIKEDEGTCDVFIRLNEYYDFGDSGLAIHYVSDLTHADAEDAQPDSYEGSNTKSNDPTVRYTTCSKCHGDGKVSCSNCSGQGYKISYAASPFHAGNSSYGQSSAVKERCFKCNGTGETSCSKCGGSGKTSYSY